jgi:PAS domain S-box-containing protein
MKIHLPSKKPIARTMTLPFAIRPEAILEAIPEIIMLLDENKVYRWANPAGLAFFGDDVIGKPASNYFADERRASETMKILFESKESVVRRENWHLRKDGEKRLLIWNNRILKNSSGHYMGAISTARDMTERRLREDYRELSREILWQLNQPGPWQGVLTTIIEILKSRTGFSAIGLRLREGNDYPYYACKGFSKEFLSTENTLHDYAGKNNPTNTHACNACLACTCGLVISGKADLNSPSFTKGGSFWTNDSLALLAPSAERLPTYRPRNLCMQYGYASLALIPIKNQEGTVGLLQLADNRKGRFTLEIVELLETVALHIGESLMRRQAEAALENERLQLRTLVDNLPCGVFFKDAKSRFVVINRPLAEAMGVSNPEAMIGCDDTAYYPPEVARKFREDELRVMREGAGQYAKEDWISLRNVSDPECLATTKVPIKNREGATIGLVGFSMDITERKRMETWREMGMDVIRSLDVPGPQPEVIQRVVSILKNRTGFDAVGIRLQDGEDFPFFAQEGFSKDFLSTENSLLEFDSQNHLCRESDGKPHMGCTCGIVISGKTDPGRPYFTKGGSFWTNNMVGLLDLPAETFSLLHSRNQCVDNGSSSLALIPIKDKDRIIGLIHLNDRRLGRFTLEIIEFLEALAMHIGESLMRRQAEASLDKERLQLRTLIDNLPYAVYVKDAECRFLLANRSLAHYMGVAGPEALVGHTDQDYHPEALARQYLEDELRIMREGVGLYNKEEHVKVAEREDLQCWSTTKVPIKDAAGQVIGLAGIGIDITEQKAAQKAIIDMAEAKSKFTSTVSHELRSPLAMIKEATNLVLEGVLGSLNDGQKEMLEITKSNVDRLGRMINNVLEYQKMEAGKTTYDLKNNKINELVKEANKGAVLFSGERKSDLVMDLEAELPEAVFDRDKIMQVLINLMANAIKYSESGPVVVKTRLKDQEIQVSVKDSGHGIAPEEHEEIFKPFSQGKGKRKGGTGLGLAIVKEIVLAHQGKIWVESELGKGSTFTFTLPV